MAYSWHWNAQPWLELQFLEATDHPFAVGVRQQCPLVTP